MTHVWYWRLVIIISFAAALGCFIQSTRVTPLVDYSYQVENSYRIFKGQLPYKDFFLVLSPGVYVVMALLMHITGGYNHLVQLIFTMLLAGGIIIVTAMVGEKFGKKTWFAFLLLPLMVSGHVLYPWPSYDMSAILAVMIALTFLLSTIRKDNSRLSRWVLAGFFISLPIFFKQNIGMVFVASMALVLFVACVRFSSRKTWQQYVAFIGGLVFPGILFYWYLIFTGSAEQFYTQTIVFPGIARTPFQAIDIIKGEYLRYGLVLQQNSVFFAGILVCLFFPLLVRLATMRLKHQPQKQFFSMIYFVSSIGCIGFFVGLIVHWWNIFPGTELFIISVLFSWVTIYICCLLFICIRLIKAKNWKHFFLALLPIPMILAAHAGYLSHHIVGSSYGLWPIFCFFLFWLIPKRISTQLTVFLILFSIYISIVLFRSLVMYDFFAYVHLEGEKKVATYHGIQGLTASGPWITDMELLFQYVAKNIPKSELIAFLPGEDPFYAVTGRENPLPFVQLHTQTYPVYASDIVELIYQYDVQWLILKTRWQLFPYFGMIDLTTPSYGVDRYFTLVDQLPSYNIYRLTQDEK